ncbi:hypothetical protein P3T76_010500 [Phytophthora citrophthora]|uniref:START domain-containing protein n=1 Tax=Phytophthora citrophthora TaxID=4793 RepID=A0AAD9GCJ6_9STRA|nr:hypothetical protein P3T76_010500 [Phytophthora citrophthora]
MSEEDISKELVIRAENGLLELDSILRESPFADQNKYHFDTSVVERNNVQDFVVFANMTLPFGVIVCVKAIWKILSSDAIKQSCYYHRVVQKSNTTVSYAFGARLSEDGVDFDLRGNYSVCLFKDGERYIIVLMGIFVPKELNGVPCQGIVCRQCGWIELTKNGSCGTQSTISRSHCRFTVDVDGNDGGLLASLCRSVAKSMHEVISRRVASIMEKVLFEEEWKANGGPDGISSSVSSPLSIDMASCDGDFSFVDTFLHEYNPAELLIGIDHSRRPTAALILTSDSTRAPSEAQSSNDTNSDSNSFPSEVIHSEARNQHAKPRRSGPKDEILVLRNELKSLRAEYKKLAYCTSQRTIALGSKGSSSRAQKLWRQLAQSQLERRRSSEEENAKLREMVATQVLEAKNLRRILKRRTRIEMMQEMFGSKGLTNLMKNTPPNDARVFQRLLLEADELFVGIDRLFILKGMDKLAFTGHSRATDLEITHGVYYEMLQKRQLPFDRQSTAKAVWECFRNLGEVNLRGVGSSNAILNAHPHIMEDEGNTLRRSFFAVISGVGDLEGTYTQKVAKRYKDSDRSVLITRLITEPRFKGSTRGVSATTSMQVVLEDGGGGTGTTVMKIYFSAERAGKPAKEDPATTMAFAAWDELVPRFPADVETFALDNIRSNFTSVSMALV